MKVKEMIEYLSQFNPDAEVYSEIKNKPFTPCFSFGHSEGCKKHNCEDVFIYVKEESDEEI